MANESTVYCTSCGAQNPATARFCKQCGAAQEEASGPEPTDADPQPTQAQPPPAAPAAPGHKPGGQRSVALPEDARELAGTLRSAGEIPGLVNAALIGALAALVCLAAGLVVAVIGTDASLLGILGQEVSLVKETFLQTASFSLANLSFEDQSARLAPATFVLVPLAACGLLTIVFGSRMAGEPPRTRLLWSAATGVPFALAMLVVAVLAGNDGPEPSIAGVFLLSAVWGALGSVAGAMFLLRREGVDALSALLPEAAARPVGLALSAAVPLAALLVVMGMLGTALVTVQTLRDSGDAAGEGTAASGIVDSVAYGGDHAVHMTELESLASFGFELENFAFYQALDDADPGDDEAAPDALFVPFPINEADELLDFDDRGELSYNIFSYSDAVPSLAFIAMIALILLPAGAALYAGFHVAGRAGTVSPAIGAAWGSLVGPVWALVMVLLNAMVTKELFGRADGESVFLAFLVGGAAFGALGGLLRAGGMEGLRRTDDTRYLG